MQQRLSIAIVGGGIAGCGAAVMLARAGHRIDLFEQSPRVGPVGAGVLLQPSGQAVLREMGLLDRVIASAERIDELIAYTHRGHLLSQLRYPDHRAGSCAYGLHRGDLFGVLHQTLLSERVAVHLNHVVTAGSRSGDGVSLSIDAGDTVGPFDLVIAADGARSRMRSIAGIPAIEHRYAPAAWWAVGQCDGVRHQLLQRTRDTSDLCGLLPMGNGRCSFFWGTRTNDPRVCRRQSFGAWRDEVLRLMPESEPIVSTFTSFDQLMFAAYRAVYTPRVHTGRLVLIGDAAHAASPHLGQGVNLALLDARDLCRSLDRARSVPEALHAYNRRQRLRNAWYSLATAALTPTFQGSLKPLGWARDLVLPRLQRIAPARAIMLATLAGPTR